jgi:hypothetical protein
MVLSVTLLDANDSPVIYPGVGSVSFDAGTPEQADGFVRLRCELDFPPNRDGASVAVIERLRVDSAETGASVVVNVFPPIRFGDAFKVAGPPSVTPRIENLEFTQEQWSHLVGRD